ncbi:hypothetical protein MRX96_011595 [Rhipicephalus microplus]
MQGSCRFPAAALRGPAGRPAGEAARPRVTQVIHRVQERAPAQVHHAKRADVGHPVFARSHCNARLARADRRGARLNQCPAGPQTESRRQRRSRAFFFVLSFGTRNRLPAIWRDAALHRCVISSAQCCQSTLPRLDSESVYTSTAPGEKWRCELWRNQKLFSAKIWGDMKAVVALLAACCLAAICDAGHIIPWLHISKSIFIKPVKYVYKEIPIYKTIPVYKTIPIYKEVKVVKEEHKDEWQDEHKDEWQDEQPTYSGGWKQQSGGGGGWAAPGGWESSGPWESKPWESKPWESKPWESKPWDSGHPQEAEVHYEEPEVHHEEPKVHHVHTEHHTVKHVSLRDLLPKWISLTVAVHKD